MPRLAWLCRNREAACVDDFKGTQFAEKIHAYTLPRNSPNSRVKDLVDLVLLISDGRIDRKRVAGALRLTFARRKAHALPASLSAPPEDWQTSFRALAGECGLDPEISVAFENVRAFFVNVLTGNIEH